MRFIKHILLAAVAAVLLAAAPAVAAPTPDDPVDVFAAMHVGTQDHAFRAGGGGIIRNANEFDWRRWSGGVDVGARIGGYVATLGVARTHTFDAVEGDDAPANAAVIGAGLASGIGKTNIALLIYGETGIPGTSNWTARRGVGIGTLVIRGRAAIGARYWPSTERLAIQVGVTIF